MGSQFSINDKSNSTNPVSILLVTPNSQTHYVVPPIGLGYLAAVVRKSGFEVSILDCLKKDLTVNQTVEAISKSDPAVIGIQVFSYDFHTTIEYVSRMKEVCPRAVIVLGGAHASGVGMEVLDQFTNADFAFTGEAEPGLPLLLQHLVKPDTADLQSIPGLIYRSNGKNRINPQQWVENLDELPFPAWDLIDPRTYPDNPQGAFYKKFPIAPISTSRGCPYQCTYCASHTISGRKIRKRSIGSVISEIEMLYQRYEVREFHIIDDTFASHAGRVKEFCQELETRNLDISFTFPNGVRLDTLNREMLVMMKDVGLYAFTVGIESGSQKILDHMKKRLTLDKIREKVNLIHEVGLEPNGFFIIGYPAEKREDIEKTIKFAKELPLKRAHFSNFLPLPGTDATSLLVEQNQIQNIDYSRLFYAQVPYSPPGISPKELKRLQQKAFLSFHLRPKILFRLISDIKSLNHLKIILKRVRDYLFKH